jgi:hypothetical protein
MRNRARVIAIGAIAATLAAGSTAAVASATSSKSSAGTQAKVVSGGSKAAGSRQAVDPDLAARLGVSPARLDAAMRAVKTSLAKAKDKPTEDEVDAALARELGIPLARVQQAFPAGPSADAKRAGAKSAGAKHAEKLGREALTAAVAEELHVSTARVAAALRPLFAAGRAETSSPIFVAAARSLGVSTAQLNTAVIHAKQSLAGGN